MHGPRHARCSTPAPTRKERIGQLLAFQGKETEHADEFGPGDIGAVAKLKETRAGDWLADARRADRDAGDQAARAGDGVRDGAQVKGDEDKVFTALRRLQEEDPTIDLHRDPQTGEQIVAGLSQIHVEVIVDRLKRALRRRGRRSSRRACPTRRRSAGRAKAHGRHKKQTGGRGQFGDCHIEIEPLRDGDELRVRRRDQGRRDPARASSRRCEKGVRRGDGRTARSPAIPVKGVRVRLFDGSYHTVDSSEMAFSMAGSIAMKRGAGGRPARCCSSRSCS